MAISFWDLSPWEQLPYCQPLKVTLNTGPFTNVQVIPANNQRVMLMFAPISAVSYSIWPQSGNVSNANAITIAANLVPVIFTPRDSGPICTFAWNGTMNGNLSVYELIMSDWPKDGDKYLDAIARPPVPVAPPQFTKDPGVQGDNGVVSYWSNLMKKIRGG